MSAHPRHARLRIRAGELQLDVLVEPLEALVAAHLGTGRAKQGLEGVMWGAHESSCRYPDAASSRRSFVRAS